MFDPKQLKNSQLSIKNGKQQDSRTSDKKDMLFATENSPTKKPIPFAEYSSVDSTKYRDPSKITFETKTLIKEIDGELSKIQVWRSEQKLELERNLHHNQERYKPSPQSIDFDKDQKEYEEYIKKLNGILTLYNEGLKNSMSYTNEFNSEGASMDQNLEKQIEESEDRLVKLNWDRQFNLPKEASNKEFGSPLDDIDIGQIKQKVEFWKSDVSSMLEGPKKSANGQKDRKFKNFRAENERKDEMVKETDEDYSKKSDALKEDFDEIESELKDLEEMPQSSKMLRLYFRYLNKQIS